MKHSYALVALAFTASAGSIVAQPGTLDPAFIYRHSRCAIYRVSTMTKIDRPAHRDKSHLHWQQRTEKNWQKFQYNQPYAKGLTNVKKVLAETNFDPATLWQWGTMQAMALIEVKALLEDRAKVEIQALAALPVKDGGGA